MYRRSVLSLFALVSGFVIGAVDGDNGPTAVYTADEYTALAINPFQSFYSRSDIWPPILYLNTSKPEDLAPGYIFIGQWGGLTPPVQPGPLILDTSGELVWAGGGNVAATAINFRVQTYQGQPVLTYWAGLVSTSMGGMGQGYIFIMDQSYNTIATVKAGNHEFADLHEFEITADNTALLTIYTREMADLTSFGVTEQAWITNCKFQEIDISTGKALFEWKAYPHVNLSDSYAQPLQSTATSSATAWDFFHMNSVQKDHAGNYLVSSRHYSAVYYINGNSGDIIWTMNGKHSSFSMGNSSAFAYQHDSKFSTNDNTITIFDNGSDGIAGHPLPTNATQSRGVQLHVNYTSMSVSLDMEYLSPTELLATSQGNVQTLENGNKFLGWGGQWYGEWSSNGTCLLWTQFSSDAFSYRAFRNEWHATPLDPPAVSTITTTSPSSNGSSIVNTTVFVSWNGATNVSSWSIAGGNTSTRNLSNSLGTFAKIGFETNVTLMGNYPYLFVTALAEDGSVLGNVTSYQNSVVEYFVAATSAGNNSVATGGRGSCPTTTGSGSGTKASSAEKRFGGLGRGYMIIWGLQTVLLMGRFVW